LKYIEQQCNWSRQPKCAIYLWMAMTASGDPILKRFRTALDEIYGDRLERVVLFGSRARGDARPDSDYDVAVFLNEPDSFWKETGRIAEIETDILYATGAVINALPFRAGAYRDRTPLMHEMRREGLDL
jgi:predicted nucleotidyltransferase